MKQLGEGSYLKSKMLSLLLRNPGNRMYYYLWKKVEELTKGEIISYDNNYWSKYQADLYHRDNWIVENNRVLIKDVDIEKFIRRDGWDRNVDDYDEETVIEYINKANNLQSLYEVVSYIIRVVDHPRTHIFNDYLLESCLVKQKREAPGGDHIATQLDVGF